MLVGKGDDSGGEPKLKLKLYNGTFNFIIILLYIKLTIELALFVLFYYIMPMYDKF